MTPTSFKETNKIFGAGDNPNTDQLPVCICTNPGMADGQNIPFIVSKWKLTDLEMEVFKERGEIWISIMGTGMAPISPMVHNPFTELGFKPIKI